MVEGQVIEEVGAGVGDLVLGVVALVAEGAGELAEVELEAGAYGRKVGAVGLVEVAPDLGALLVGAGALKGFSGLTELQVDAAAEAALRRGEVLHDEAGLVDVEAVAGDVVGAQEVDAADGCVEVVAVVAVDGDAEGG